MATSRRLLERLLTTPDLARAVPRLKPEVVHRVIQMAGLEDSAEVVRHLSPGQLARVFDLDLWRSSHPGREEQFDADRFGLWIGVLLECGPALAAEKLQALDIDLVISGLARHLAVSDCAAVSAYTTLDGEYLERRTQPTAATCEIGGYVVVPKSTDAWEPIVELLVFLDAESPVFFDSLMRGCVRLSSGVREEDGLHERLHDDEQQAFELASKRNVRREREGYVTPAEAAAFLQEARTLPDRVAPRTSAIVRAYFRHVTSDIAEERDLPVSDVVSSRAPEADSVRAVADILLDAGVLTGAQRLLPAAGEPSVSRFALSGNYLASDPHNEEALGFLANALLAGCSIQGRPFTIQEAADAVLATCNLGLENWARDWPRPDLVAAFQIGWRVLHRDVCTYSAARLADALDDVSCSDRDVDLELRSLRDTLLAHVRSGEPWRARRALDVILTLDSTCWAALLAAIDECPVAHAATMARKGQLHRISPTDFTFISENREIAAIRSFMSSLAEALAR